MFNVIAKAKSVFAPQTKTVGSIMCAFSTAIDELRQVAREQTDEASAQGIAAAQAQAAQTAALAEAHRAICIAARLTAIIGEDEEECFAPPVAVTLALAA